MSSRMMLLLQNREVGSQSGSGTGCAVASHSFYVGRRRARAKLKDLREVQCS